MCVDNCGACMLTTLQCVDGYGVCVCVLMAVVRVLMAVIVC